MQSPLPLRLAFVGRRLLGMTLLCGCSLVQPGRRAPMEGVSMPFVYEGEQRAWNIGHTAEDELWRVTEMVLPGETVENWTQLVTLQVFGRTVALASVDDQLSAHRRDLAERCPGSTLEILREATGGVLYEVHVVNCEQGADEYGVGRVLDGNSNRFVLQYAVRHPVSWTPERRSEWIEKLMAVRLMTLR